MFGRTRLLTVAAVLTILLASTGIAAGTGGAVGTDATSASMGAFALQDGQNGTEDVASGDGATSPDTATDAPEHVRPDTADGGDDGATAGWLERRLGGLLSDGAIELEQGEYELASEYVGDSYRERLEQYVDVEGEGSADEYRQAAESQRELTDLLTEYQETLDAYDAARDGGNETRARELARELADLSDRIQAVGVELQRSFTVLNESTEGEYANTSDSVNETIVRIGNDTEEITEASLVETTLTASADRRQIAADAPLAIEGRLTQANGTPISNATIAVLDPAGATTTTTDAEGRYTLDHRPVLLRTNATELTVAYRPAATAAYAGATASVPVNVSQIDATLGVTGVDGGDSTARAPNVAFGTNASLDVATTLDGMPLAGVPVRATLDGSVDAATSAANGTAVLAPTVDAGVRAGERTVSVRVPVEDRAVAFEPSSTAVVVEATATSLTLDARPNATDSDAAGVAVSGTLRTATGEPVPNVSVAIAAGGTPATTVQTNADGRYATTVAPDAFAGRNAGDDVTVAASYDGSGSNLESARSNATTTLQTAATSESGLFDGVGPLALLAIVAGVALLLGAGWLVRRDDDSPDGGPSPDGTSTTPEPTEAAPHDVVDDARERLDADPVAATALAYGAARASLADRVPGSDRRTHREFLADSADDGLEGTTVDALRTVTERYETAEYGPTGIDAQGAAEAVDAAERVAAAGERPD